MKKFMTCFVLRKTPSSIKIVLPCLHQNEYPCMFVNFLWPISSWFIDESLSACKTSSEIMLSFWGRKITSITPSVRLSVRKTVCALNQFMKRKCWWICHFAKIRWNILQWDSNPHAFWQRRTELREIQQSIFRQLMTWLLLCCCLTLLLLLYFGKRKKGYAFRRYFCSLPFLKKVLLHANY